MQNYYGKLSGSLKKRVSRKYINQNLDRGIINQNSLKRIAVNREFRICYNRIQKNANSTTVLLLSDISSSSEQNARESKENIAKIANLSLSELKDINKFRFFVVVRNPYSRVLSAFLEKFSMEKFRKKHREFSLDPSGFHEFVRWLDAGGLSTNSHWNLQRKQLCFQLKHYDAVIRFENYHSEMYDFLINSGVPADRINLQNSSRRGSHHKTDADKKLWNFYDPETQRLVRKMFKIDFESLGYDTDLSNNWKSGRRVA